MQRAILMATVLVAGALEAARGAWADEPNDDARPAAGVRETSDAAAVDDKTAENVHDPIDYVPAATVTVARKSMVRIESKLYERMARPVDLVTLADEESSLKEATEHITKQVGVPVEFDVTALDELGIGTDSPIELTLDDEVPAATALRLVLDSIDPEVTWMVRDDVVLVTTREVEDEHPTIKLYDVADLAGCSSGLPGDYCDADGVIELITTTIDPDTWEESGGSGRVAEFESPGLAVIGVTTRHEVHARIEALLASLRSLRHRGIERRRAVVSLKQPKTLKKFHDHGWPEVKSAAVNSPKCSDRKTPLPTPHANIEMGVAPSEAEKRILSRLDQLVDVSQAADEDASLEDWIEFLSDLSSLSIQFDYTALEELGVSVDEPVAIHVAEDISLRSALRILLTKIDPELTFMIKNDLLTITTKEVESESLITRVFDVVYLTASCTRDDGVLDSDVDPLIEFINGLIEPGSWEEAGGGGRISHLNVTGIRALTVSQTQDNLDRVERMLRVLRAMRRKDAQLYDCDCVEPPELRKPLEPEAVEENGPKTDEAKSDATPVKEETPSEEKGGRGG